jgi:hypothetical protein
MKPQQRDKRGKPDKRAKRDYIFGKFGERDMFKPQSDYQDHRSQVTGQVGTESGVTIVTIAS